jgi:hypothetical protein
LPFQGEEAPVKNRITTPRKRWEPDEIRYLRRNYGKKSLKELSRVIGKSVPSIRIAAHALNLTKGKRNVPLDRT